MLGEAELQELRGMSFDRLLLQLWPKKTNLRMSECRNCGSSEPDGSGCVVHGRGLCNKCYGKWRYRERVKIAPPIAPGPSRSGAFIQCEDALLARRIGVSRGSLKNWRNGVSAPLPRTFNRILPNLETEFGVPAGIWADAMAISNVARGYVRTRSGERFMSEKVNKKIYPLPDRNEVGRQFGYRVVLGLVCRRYTRGGQARMRVNAQCLLCKSTKEVSLHNVTRDSRGFTGACLSCAHRLRYAPGRSGLRGVRYIRDGVHEYWEVRRSKTHPPGLFKNPTEAARYYDACMYERYGHTLFLNFPDEYDRSNDPAFVPVGANR